MSDDGRWLFAAAGSGTSNNRLWIADLGQAKKPNLTAPFAVVAPEEDAIYNALGVVGRTLYLYTTWNAPNGRIVAATLGDTNRAGWRDVVPATDNAISESMLVGDRLAVVYLVDVQSRVSLFDLKGASRGEVKLPEPGTAAGLSGRNDGADFFFAFSSYLRPTTIYRYDLKSGALSPFHAIATPFDASAYETRAAFYQSKDGTRVPIFITARKGIALDGSHPTLLYGYGGFDVSLQPFYSPASAAWIELGGVYAVANLRGGSEYGEAWHHAGMRDKKQNVFDDFIAAAEFLIHEGYTTPQRLAIQGGSNGGLLVGAVMTQRPDLFGVALPAVGVMDMLRYQDFTGGRFWARRIRFLGRFDRGGVPPGLLTTSQPQAGNLLPGDTGYHGGPRRPGGPQSLVQVRGDAAGRPVLRQADSHPDRDRRQPRLSSDRPDHRRDRRRVRLCIGESGQQRSLNVEARRPMLQAFDPRNKDLVVNINGRLVHRDQAGISPFDSAVQGGDAVWEGLRLYRGRIFRLAEHLDRLHHSALALAFQEIPSREAITEEIRRTLDANRMTRRSAHPAHLDPRGQDHLGHGPSTQPVGARLSSCWRSTSLRFMPGRDCG